MKAFWGGVIVLLSLLVHLRAASEFSEPFDVDVSGWSTSNSGLAQLSHVAADQSIRVRLIGFGGPDPNSYSLIATNGASSGAFVGDYLATGVNFISFDFMAEDVIPSELIARLTGPEGTYFFNLTDQVVQTGWWYRFMVSITSQSAGGWVGSSSNGFDSFLGQVDEFRIQLVKSGTATQGYRFDNIALERIPQATSILINGANETEMRWSYLAAGVNYTVQAADSPHGTWVDIGSFMSLSNEHDFVDSAASAILRRVYRLGTP